MKHNHNIKIKIKSN